MSKIYVVVKIELLMGEWIRKPIQLFTDWVDADVLCQRLNKQSPTSGEPFEVDEL